MDCNFNVWVMVFFVCGVFSRYNACSVMIGSVSIATLMKNAISTSGVVIANCGTKKAVTKTKPHDA